MRERSSKDFCFISKQIKLEGQGKPGIRPYLLKPTNESVHLLFEKSGKQKSPDLGGYALMRAAGHTTVFLHSSSFKE